MKRTIAFVMLVSLIVALSIGNAQEPVRRFKSNGRAIASQLLATDRHVEMEVNDSTPLWVVAPNRNRTFIESTVDQCEVIVTGKVEEASPRLVVRSYLETANVTALEATANWVVSTVRLRVIRVIKDSTQKLTPGGVLEFEQSGGTARIGTVTVDAVVPWRMPMVLERRYLYCEVDAGAGKRFPGLTYEIAENGLLRKMSQPELGSAPTTADAPNEFESSGAENVIGMLEAEAQNPTRAR